MVTKLEEVEHYTPAPKVFSDGAILTGLKVFIPKNFFAEDLLPDNHHDMFGCVLLSHHTPHYTHPALHVSHITRAPHFTSCMSHVTRITCSPYCASQGVRCIAHIT